MTLVFFPVCVLWAWIADRRLLLYKYNKRYRADKRHGIVVEMEGNPSIKGVDGVIDGKFSDGNSCAGNSCAGNSTAAVDAADGNKDEVGKVENGSPAVLCCVVESRNLQNKFF